MVQVNSAETPWNASSTTDMSEEGSEYARVRIQEVTKRAELYGLKVNKLKGELLDRKMLEAELGAVFAAIRSIVLGSRMAKEEKTDCLKNLSEVSTLLENVAQKQANRESLSGSQWPQNAPGVFTSNSETLAEGKQCRPNPRPDR